MAIEITYKKACNMFLQCLKESRVKMRVYQGYKILLDGSFKLFIAENLKVYPLLLKKLQGRYSAQYKYSFAHAFKKYNSFIKSNPHLLSKSFIEIFSSFKISLSNFKQITINNIIKNIRRIVFIDIDEMLLSRIPEKVIKQCMGTGTRHTLVRGRRFFKFLINSNLLSKKHLPVYISNVEKSIARASFTLRPDMNIDESISFFMRYISNTREILFGALRSYYYHLNGFLIYVGEKKKICEINNDDIRNYLNYLSTARGYSPVSKSSILTTLRSLFRYFYAEKVIKKDPTDNIHIKKLKKIEKTLFNEEELKEIFTKSYLVYKQYEDRPIEDAKMYTDRWIAARDWAIISLLICTGIRRKEIVALHIDAIDFTGRNIYIKGKGDNNHRVRERIIPITEPIALTALETYLHLRPCTIFKKFFLNRKIEPLRVPGFICVLKKIKNIVFPDKSFTITKIRRSFVSLCAHKGMDPLVLKQIMGHNTLKTTMKYYLTVQEQQLKSLWEQNNPLLYFSKEEYEQWLI
jgi:site-specific recombinase XerD